MISGSGHSTTGLSGSHLRELDEWYSKIPDDENVALVYTNVFAKIALASNAFNKIKEDSWVPKRGQAIAAEDKAEINCHPGNQSRNAGAAVSRDQSHQLPLSD